MLGVRYLAPRGHRDHGHVVTFYAFRRFLSIEIDTDGDVVVLYSDRSKPEGLVKVWIW